MAMKILAIGATGFIGPHVIRRLQQRGHLVTVLHRGKSVAPGGVRQIIADRNRLNDYRDAFKREEFDLVIDFVLSSARQARQLMETLRGITQRVVALSSMDVYRAWGVFYGMEPGGLEPMPVNEDSALRSVSAYPPEMLKRVSQMVSWVDEEYDKIPAERIVMGEPDLGGTVLRLPMIYGPGDYAHRFHLFLKRMDDGRPFIPFAADVAPLRTPRGYVEDVAEGIALAATSDRAAGRIYNICEPEASSELEWAKKIAAAVGWPGRFVLLPRDKAPAHLIAPYNTAQHLVVSSERIRKELGYREVTPPAEAFARTIEWERANPPQAVSIPFNYEAEDAAVDQLKASA
jgi:nucleoside-diphosphate-sugar epimerase